jgi:hypothetical protein
MIPMRNKMASIRKAVSMAMSGGIIISVSSCGTLDYARRFTDAGLAKYQEVNIEFLVQAEMERQRLRRARCYSPLLSPAAVSTAAGDPRLGAGWVDDLMRDCPQFSAFVAQLIVQRVGPVGLAPEGESH